MKSKIKVLLFLLVLIPFKASALSTNISCSSTGEVYVGDSFNVTIYGQASEEAYWQSDYVYSSSNLRLTSGSGAVFSDNASSSLSKTYTFTALSTGTASVNQTFIVSDYNGNESTITSNTCYINIVQPSSPSDSYSSDTYYDDDDEDYDEIDENLSNNNYLKVLEVNNFKISPAFNKDTSEYSSIVNGDIEKVTIKAELEDETASLSGPTEVELKEGINRVELVVTAENGETRSYVINITRKEKNPLEVTINKKKYTVFKKESSLKVPEGFTKTTLVIDKQEVVAYSNSFTKYIIVTLVDERGFASWFIYDQKNGSYSKYSELKSDSVRLIILTPDKKDIPHKYKSIKFYINNEEVNGYMLEYMSPYRLYALNMSTGEKSFYLYDMDEKTFQRFYNRQVNIYIDLVKKLEVVMICLGSLILILLIIVFCQMIMKRKIKKYVTKPSIPNENKEIDKKEIEKEKVIEEEKELPKEEKNNKKNKKVMTEKINTDIIKEKIDKDIKQEDTKNLKEIKDEYQEEEPLSKKDLKKKLKEEKKQLRKERKEFLD